jgi:hypothetical protein
VVTHARVRRSVGPAQRRLRGCGMSGVRRTSTAITSSLNKSIAFAALLTTCRQKGQKLGSPRAFLTCRQANRKAYYGIRQLWITVFETVNLNTARI